MCKFALLHTWLLNCSSLTFPAAVTGWFKKTQNASNRFFDMETFDKLGVTCGEFGK